MRSVDIEELENKLRQERNEKVGAFDGQLRKMQQKYQHNTDEVQIKHLQVGQDSLEASEHAELTRQLDDVRRVKNELQQQREQQQRQMEETKAQ